MQRQSQSQMQLWIGGIKGSEEQMACLENAADVYSVFKVKTDNRVFFIKCYTCTDHRHRFETISSGSQDTYRDLERLHSQ